MRAAFFNGHGGPEVLQVGEVPTPVPGPGEVLVRVKRSALNHLDVWVRRGLPGLKPSYPHVPGADGAGVVAALGAGVTGLKEGDEVIVHPGLSCGRCPRCLSAEESLCPSYKILGEHVGGTHGEYVKAPAANLFPKPAALDFADAAAMPLVFTTAWHMLTRKASVRPGDRVLIHAAASGVSSAAIQIARRMGLEIIATAGTAEKLELAKALGAHHTVLYQSQDLTGAVKKIAPKGVDLVVDHVGAAVWEASLKCLRWGGEIVLCGATTGSKVTVDLTHVFYRQLRIVGSTMGSKGDFPAILRGFERGDFRAVVGLELPLGDIRRAHEELERRSVLGKIVLHIE